MSVTSPCRFCIHHSVGRKCKAFPDKIPSSIYFSELYHSSPINGQKGDFIFTSNDENERLRSINFLKNLRQKKNEIQDDIKKLIIQFINNSLDEETWTKCVIDIKMRPNNGLVIKGEKSIVVIFTEKDGAIISHIINEDEIFSKCISLLVIENSDHHKNRLRIKLYPNSKIDFIYHFETNMVFEFLNKKQEYEKYMNDIITSKKDNLKRLTEDEALNAVSLILEMSDKDFPTNNTTISILLEESGYLLLEHEISRIRYTIKQLNHKPKG